MRIAFTHNLRLTDSEDEAEFDSVETVDAIADALRAGGHEVEKLETAGIPVICLEPDSEARHVMGLRAMAEDRSPRVIEAAYEETRRRILETPFLATLGQPGTLAASAG